MALEIATETLVTSAGATDYVPHRRRGRKCSPSTIWRWMVYGCRGIRLESLVVGTTRCTSVQALQRFFDALTEAAEAEQVRTPPGVPTKTRLRQIEAAEQRLAKAGISNKVARNRKPVAHHDAGRVAHQDADRGYGREPDRTAGERHDQVDRHFRSEESSS